MQVDAQHVPLGGSTPNPALNLNIIRIKRKATEPPLTSLVVQEGERANKRLRDDKNSAPLPSPGATNQDSTSGHGVFRLVQTVGHDWSAKANEEAALREKINRLIEEQKRTQISLESPEIPTQTGPQEEDPISGVSVTSPVPTPSIPQERRYRVIKPAYSQSRKSRGNQSGTGGVEPIKRLRVDFRLIDAQLESDAPPPSTRRAASPPRRRATSPGPPVVRTEEDIPPRLNRGKERMRHEVEEVDEEMREMEKFLPMLTESLALNERSKSDASKDMSLITSLESSQVTTIPIHDQDGEWVYDLYYREPTASHQNGPVGTGLLGDGVTMIGALAGLEELLDDDDDPGSDSEEGDEADEDSNEENFYRNEYPEEEESIPSSSVDDRYNPSQTKARPLNKKAWAHFDADEYYNTEDHDDYEEDSEEEEKRMPDWRIGLSRLQRKLRGEERQRDRTPIGSTRMIADADDEDEDEMDEFDFEADE